MQLHSRQPLLGSLSLLFMNYLPGKLGLAVNELLSAHWSVLVHFHEKNEPHGATLNYLTCF